MLSSDDYGKDLASVNALLRKHEALERDLAAVEDKVEIRLFQKPNRNINTQYLRIIVLS